MKLLLPIAFLLLFFLQAAVSFSQRWDHLYGTSNRAEYGEDIIETYDNGYLICGGYNNNTTWLIKTDLNGNVLWEKTILADGGNLSNAIIETSDHGWVISGEIIGIYGIFDPFVMKLDSCGEKVWCREFPVLDRWWDSWAYDIIETAEHDLVFTADQYGTDEHEWLYLFKLDSLGEVKWRHPILSSWTHPNEMSPTSFNLIETPDSGYLISCDAYWLHPWDTITDIYWLRPTFVKVNEEGEEEWIYPFGLQDTLTGMTRSSIILDDENYLGLGGFWPGGSVVYPLFMKFNDTGNNYGYRIMNPEIIDSITISGGFEYGLLCDSVFIFSGDFEVIPGDEYQIAEVIMDTSIISSSLIIYNHILHPHTQYPHMLNKTSDHKILSVMTYENTDYKSDIYLSKMNMELETDSIYTGNYTYDSLCTGGIQSGTMTLDDCEIYTGMDDFPTPQKHYASLATIPIAIYPNPAGSELTITLQNTAYNSDITLTCFDITGRKVYALEVQKGQYEMQLDITRWSPGLYMAVVTSQGRVAGEKRFVVMK